MALVYVSYTMVPKWEGWVNWHSLGERLYLPICRWVPSLNRNLRKYQLPHIWDEVLQDTQHSNSRNPLSPLSSMGQSPMAPTGWAHNFQHIGNIVLPPGGANSPCFPIMAPLCIKHKLVPSMVSRCFGKYNIFS